MVKWEAPLFTETKPTTMITLQKHILTYFTLFLLSLFSEVMAQKTLVIEPISEAITIDGTLSEAFWKTHLQEGNFIQSAPNNGEPATRSTQVAIGYDHNYLYVAAVLFVANKEEINHQLTARDDNGNSDFFGIQLDPFGEAREGYDFTVTAAGVQLDEKLSATDGYRNFNVVWQSDVQLYDDKWIVEFKIPFNSIRFPKEDMTNFKINFQRVASKLNEESFWNPIKPEIDGFLNQFGNLKGLRKVTPPLNISLYPFVSGVSEKSASGETKTSLNGGLDLKYVLNNAYTLDVSLIPDFSQAPSDDQILNLSPFEIQYDENRQFFVEGTEIFDKGGYLYTRRIGGTPINSRFTTSENEEIVSNPVSSNIINLLKVTGKSSNGLSIGLLNGVTDKSEAEVLNTETGTIRTVETNPLTNYTSLVLDQSLKNNASITLVNNSVLRNGRAYDANLTALQYQWYNAKRSFSLRAKKGISQQYFSEEKNKIGHEYFLYAGKISGKWTSGISGKLYDKTYNPNDFGYLSRNNQLTLTWDLRYSENNAKKTFSRYQYFFLHQQRYYYSLFKNELTYYKLGGNATTKKSNHTIFAEWTYIQKGRNFYEARVEDRYYNIPAQTEAFFEYQTNSNKNLSFAGYVVLVNYMDTSIFDREFIAGYGIRARIGQHLNAYFSQSYEHKPSNAGFLTFEDDTIIFGQRSIQEWDNSLTLNFALNAKMNVSARLRHYWIQVENKKHYELLDSGDLVVSNTSINVSDFDDNYNNVTFDFLAKWQFAPASELSFGCKLGATLFNTDVRSSYFDNLKNSIAENSNQTLSLKMTYFLDATTLRSIQF